MSIRENKLFVTHFIGLLYNITIAVIAQSRMSKIRLAFVQLLSHSLHQCEKLEIKVGRWTGSGKKATSLHLVLTVGVIKGFLS